jgi:aminopeptidase-like protein
VVRSGPLGSGPVDEPRERGDGTVPGVPADEDLGRRLHDQITRLFPLPRSLTGDGVRATLAVLAETLPLEVHEVPTGSPALDWTVPREWRAHGATLTAPDGRVVADLATDPLALVGYSAPFRGRLALEELRPHLHSLPDRPTLTPYRTSYYREDWGLCLPHRQVESLAPGDYDVVVDTELVDGSLTYGELVLPGSSPGEVLFSAHVCHPAQANDNLSGVVLAAWLAAELSRRPSRRWTYRFLFAPGTLGALVWLERHRDAAERVRAGLVLTGLGDGSGLSYKRSRRGDSLVDRTLEHVLRSEPQTRVLPFSPYGYDERQFCSPGFDLPVGRLSRGVHGEYAEYHTSADDLSFVSPPQLAASAAVLERVVDVLERDRTFRNTSPYGEPQLGRRGLYRDLGATPVDRASQEMALLWVLNLSDGTAGLLEVADRSGLPFAVIADAAQRLVEAELLVEVEA